MAYETGALDANLAMVADGDTVLLAELRQAFRESLANHVSLLRRARCDGNWHVAAMRLKGLATSFHAEALIDLAEDALELAPGDPTVVQRLENFLDEFPV
jgi:hypothetical protein